MSVSTHIHLRLPFMLLHSFLVTASNHFQKHNLVIFFRQVLVGMILEVFAVPALFLVTVGIGSEDPLAQFFPRLFLLEREREREREVEYADLGSISHHV